MATIDVTWTPVFDFKACGCSPVSLRVAFNVPAQALSAVWPVDGAGNPLPMPYTLDMESSGGTVLPTQPGQLLPTVLDIGIEAGLADDAYGATLTLYDPTDTATEFSVLTKIVLVDCAAQCCENKLALLARDARKCGRELMDDLTRVALFRKQAKRLLDCDNNVTGAKEMLDSIAAICRKYNCGC